MDLKEIQTLIKFISSSGVDEVAIEKKDFKINIKKNLPPVISPSAVHAQPALALAAPQAVADATAPAAEAVISDNTATGPTASVRLVPNSA